MCLKKYIPRGVIHTYSWQSCWSSCWLKKQKEKTFYRLTANSTKSILLISWWQHKTCPYQNTSLLLNSTHLPHLGQSKMLKGLSYAKISNKNCSGITMSKSNPPHPSPQFYKYFWVPCCSMKGSQIRKLDYLYTGHWPSSYLEWCSYSLVDAT